MDTSTMISALESTGHVPMEIAMIGDMLQIDKRAKYGDESGWRGDPTMCVCLNAVTGWWEIWGLDNHHVPYMAASHHTLDETLIIKLRDGDPQRHDVMQRVLDENDKRRKDEAAVERDKFGEFADKWQHAVRQTFAGELGGRGGNLLAERKGKF